MGGFRIEKERVVRWFLGCYEAKASCLGNSREKDLEGTTFLPSTSFDFRTRGHHSARVAGSTPRCIVVVVIIVMGRQAPAELDVANCAANMGRDTLWLFSPANQGIYFVKEGGILKLQEELRPRSFWTHVAEI